MMNKVNTMKIKVNKIHYISYFYKHKQYIKIKSNIVSFYSNRIKRKMKINCNFEILFLGNKITLYIDFHQTKLSLLDL